MTKIPTTAAKFLGELFPELPANHRLLSWELSTKRSRWFPSAEELAKYLSGKTDIYFGCAISPKDYGATNRCPIDETAGIPGVWIDLDYGKAGHKKKKLPATLKDVTALALRLAKPTVILKTGHGIQVWWLFNEPWYFENAKERAKGISLVERWQQAFRQIAEEDHKWEVDATHDLARIFRAPGTFNGKDHAKNPKAKLLGVMVDEANTGWSQRCEPGDLEEFIPENINAAPQPKFLQQAPDKGTIPAGFPVVEVRPDRGPSPKKWKVLQAADDRVTTTWNRKRRDISDTSASAHDMALACFAAQANWSNQEICNLLVACGIHHGNAVKTAAYYSRTIGRAKDATERLKARQVIDDIATFGSTEGIEPEDIEGRRKKILEALSVEFALVIKRIIKFKTEPPAYRIETERGAINLGDVENLIEQGRLRRKVAAAADKMIPKFTRIEWDQIAQTLLDACEHVDAGDEATDKGLVTTWLLKYLGEFRPSEMIEDAVSIRRPFIKETKVHIFSTEFSSWLVVSFRERVNQKQLGVMLRNFGAEPKNVRAGGKVVSTWCFKPFSEKLPSKLC